MIQDLFITNCKVYLKENGSISSIQMKPLTFKINNTATS